MLGNGGLAMAGSTNHQSSARNLFKVARDVRNGCSNSVFRLSRFFFFIFFWLPKSKLFQFTAREELSLDSSSDGIARFRVVIHSSHAETLMYSY